MTLSNYSKCAGSKNKKMCFQSTLEALISYCLYTASVRSSSPEDRRNMSFYSARPAVCFSRDTACRPLSCYNKILSSSVLLSAMKLRAFPQRFCLLLAPAFEQVRNKFTFASQPKGESQQFQPMSSTEYSFFNHKKEEKAPCSQLTATRACLLKLSSQVVVQGARLNQCAI